MPKNSLLNCPFCGKSGKLKNVKRIAYYVECQECMASTGPHVREQGAIDAWNLRDGVSIKE